MLIVDSREKWTQSGNKDTHIPQQLAKQGIEYRIEKLDAGDYMLEGGHISIDRKQNLEELSSNLTNPADKERFYRELRRASESGIKLIVLCEHGGRYHKIRDVAAWKSKYSPVTGQSLLKAMYRANVAYGVDFEFCSKRSTVKRIMELLAGSE